MIQRASAPTSKPTPQPTPESEAPTTGLAEQKDNFTSEGSPPPGKVGTSPPATPSATVHQPKRPAPHAAATAGRNSKQPPWSRSR